MFCVNIQTISYVSRSCGQNIGANWGFSVSSGVYLPETLSFSNNMPQVVLHYIAQTAILI